MTLILFKLFINPSTSASRAGMYSAVLWSVQQLALEHVAYRSEEQCKCISCQDPRQTNMSAGGATPRALHMEP